MKYLKIIIMTVLVAAMGACNSNEIFEREQYKNVVAVLSEGTFNIFAEEHDLAGGDVEGYTDGFIAASVGGVLVTAQPITLSIVEDESLFHAYNMNNFDTESYRYARRLSEDRYVVEQPFISIPESERGGTMRIRMKVNGLSPDSVYLIPFRVHQCSAHELNQQKSTVLYRIYLKNFWASTTSIPSYNHRGLRTEGTGVPVNTMMQKAVHPVAGNAVRIFAGNSTFAANEKSIVQWGIQLTMDANSHVTISPWDTSPFGMQVKQVDGDLDYPNIFKLIDDGFGRVFKTFLLCYEYVDPTNNVTYMMKEELRTEYVKNNRNQ